jgi:hypothetical protein
MIEFLPAGGIFKDSPSVFMKLFGDCDGTGNGPTFEDLIHHVLLTIHIAILVHRVDLCTLLCPATLPWHAVLALDHSCALNSVGMTKSLVRGAALIGDVVLVDPLIGGPGIPAIATFIWGLTGDEDLGSDDDVRPLSVPSNFNPVAEGRRGREGPTGPTVYGDMLVSLDGEVVDAIDIPPEMVGGKVSLGGNREGLTDIRLEIRVVDVHAVHLDIGTSDSHQEDGDGRNYFHAYKINIEIHDSLYFIVHSGNQLKINSCR